MFDVLDDATRAKHQARARRSGLAAQWSSFKISTDDKRRRNATARAVEATEEGFDRPTLRLTPRGYRGRGGGRTSAVGRVTELRATTVQAAGLWPWSVGAGAPLVGTPVGSHLRTGRPVCMDLLNWFINGFITAPVGFVLALNGYGKSTFVRRQVLGGIAQGVASLIVADVKPDYRALIEAVGGQVIDLGYGYGRVNPLAGGVLGSIIPRLAKFPDLQRRMLQELRGRQVETVSALIELVRGRSVEDYEETIIATCLRLLYSVGGFTPLNPPLLQDMLDLVKQGHLELIEDAGEDDLDGYLIAVKNLRRSLRGLIRGRFGEIFNGHTTTEIDIDAVSVCIDVSHIPSGDKKLKAAVMLVCWSDGFAAIDAAHALADAGEGPQRYYQVILDEMWDVLGLGPFMVDRVNALTRLNRTIATALWMILHSLADLEAVSSPAEVAKAMGFFERARIKVIGPVPEKEIDRLDKLSPFTAAERDMVTRWSDPPPLIGEARRPGEPVRIPAGMGKFIIKYGEGRRPGIPVQLHLTHAERESGVHDTDSRFSEFGNGRFDNVETDQPADELAASGVLTA